MLAYERLGADDALTKESEAFLSSLASSAVRVARMQKDARVRAAREPLEALRGATSGELDAPAPSVPAPPESASRSIDDLVRYIQGSDKTPRRRRAPRT